MLGLWDRARRNPVQKLYESQEAQLPIGVSDPVLEDNVKRHRWAKSKFLPNQRNEYER